MKRWKIIVLVVLFLITGCQNNQSSSSEATNSPIPVQPILRKISTAEEIETQAKQQTVMITGKGNGTGIIIGKNGNTYYVLTSRHVIGIKPGQDINLPPDLGHDEQHLSNQEDPYKVVVFDGQIYAEYKIDYDQIEKDPDFDLAIIKFDADHSKQYQPARLNISPIQQDQTVYIYGFKDCFNKSVKEREEFKSGVIISDSGVVDADQGYTLKYTNPTITGMSGSPVYDAYGRVLAIHGKPGKSKGYDIEKCSNLTDEYANNFGISMATFHSSSLIEKLPINLYFDNQVIEDISSPSQKENKPQPTPSQVIKFKRS